MKWTFHCLLCTTFTEDGLGLILATRESNNHGRWVGNGSVVGFMFANFITVWNFKTNSIVTWEEPAPNRASCMYLLDEHLILIYLSKFSIVKPILSPYSTDGAFDASNTHIIPVREFDHPQGLVYDEVETNENGLMQQDGDIIFSIIGGYEDARRNLTTIIDFYRIPATLLHSADASKVLHCPNPFLVDSVLLPVYPDSETPEPADFPTQFDIEQSHSSLTVVMPSQCQQCILISIGPIPMQIADRSARLRRTQMKTVTLWDRGEVEDEDEDEDESFYIPLHSLCLASGRLVMLSQDGDRGILTVVDYLPPPTRTSLPADSLPGTPSHNGWRQIR
ncbi:hypothetical protein H0H92_006145 [Tricholoma furcatifolium]|nr:hypothetical protein H0H92_006145 [Tricholoma furcatifolium]